MTNISALGRQQAYIPSFQSQISANETQNINQVVTQLIQVLTQNLKEQHTPTKKRPRNDEFPVEKSIAKKQKVEAQPDRSQIKKLCFHNVDEAKFKTNSNDNTKGKLKFHEYKPSIDEKDKSFKTEGNSLVSQTPNINESAEIFFPAIDRLKDGIMYCSYDAQGRRHGKAKVIFNDQHMMEYRYDRGIVVGTIFESYVDGGKLYYTLLNQRRHGPALYVYPNDAGRLTYNYHHGIKQGNATETRGGKTLTFSFDNGLRVGPATLKNEDGTILLGYYDGTGKLVLIDPQYKESPPEQYTAVDLTTESENSSPKEGSIIESPKEPSFQEGQNAPQLNNDNDCVINFMEGDLDQSDFNSLFSNEFQDHL